MSEQSGPKPRSIALTYVWGEKEMGFKLPRTLKPAVHTDGNGVEVIDLPAALPRTVRDALEVTRSLGSTYLWVDSLCIIQDDDEDRQNLINMMDEIYKNASLTVAAGSSLHTDWGLPGISITRSKSQQTERIGQREFAVAFPSLKGINSTPATVQISCGILEGGHCKRSFSPIDYFYSPTFRCISDVTTPSSRKT